MDLDTRRHQLGEGIANSDVVVAPSRRINDDRGPVISGLMNPPIIRSSESV
ncbi:hypothetical protein JCM18909_1989 [Cutibacterium acnes JCM 18909]|nr:hypothetical protein JCM18909_1989 [Cutibacterium acnes JCM 18909]